MWCYTEKRHASAPKNDIISHPNQQKIPHSVPFQSTPFLSISLCSTRKSKSFIQGNHSSQVLVPLVLHPTSPVFMRLSGLFLFCLPDFCAQKKSAGVFPRHSFRKSFSMMFSILRRAVFRSISCQFSVQHHKKHYIPACFATSAAKSSWRFSMPSPVSQRRKLLMVIFAPFSFATCSTYLLTGCLPSSAFTYT